MNSEFLYTVEANTTTCKSLEKKKLNEMCHISRNFTVNVVTTFLFRDKLYLAVIALCLVLGLVLTICKKENF